VVSNAGLAAWDFGLRGGATGIFLVVALVQLRDRRLTRTTVLRPALLLAAAAFAISSAPTFPSFRWWSVPVRFLSAGAPVLVWLWARAAFDDDFKIRRWHGAVWAIVGLVGVAPPALARTPWPSLADMTGQSLSLLSLLFAALAGTQALTTWRADLMAGRRRLRVAVLMGACSYMVALAATDFLPQMGAGPATALPTNLGSALALCTLAVLGGWTLLRTVDLQPATGNDTDRPSRAAPEAVSLVDQAQLERLRQMMDIERAYRQEGLTIAALAAKLALPEYRLRQLINEGLGYRNFNAFLNHHRLGDAKAALSDPSQRDVPILTIAMDAGFQSIGPFNRAFKAGTGLTPSEFRRAACQTGRPD
jgi:AraC-like DNA-binding protein